MTAKFQGVKKFKYNEKCGGGGWETTKELKYVIFGKDKKYVRLVACSHLRCE